MRVKPLSLPLDASIYTEDWRGIKNKTLKEFGAFTTESINGMTGRLVFPIKNIHDDIIAFQGRYLFSELEPRYKIKPDHVSLPLYPAIVKPIKNSIILVEGLIDAINLYDKGLTNVVTTFGTAFGNVKAINKQKINIDKLLLYKYQGVETIYILYDNDDPGRNAAKTLNNYIGSTFFTVICDMPNDKSDPGALNQEDVNLLKEKLYD